MTELHMEDQMRNKRRRRNFFMLLAAMGPGITVMLADTDAGSIITAAQSGAQWGYKLILINLILVPNGIITRLAANKP